ncbi:MAG: GNAT family N-acetyltransferase [Anaerolineales bacterium]|nr:GNAT family N-acetyltransferase [Anaerolineales bacterium]
MRPILSLEIKPGKGLSPQERFSVVTLCSQAFGEDFEPYLQTFKDPIHILGKIEGELVSHALWITRWLQVEALPLLRTAYVEAVATHETQRKRGFATLIMTRLAVEIQAYDLGALSPADTSLYARLGWEFWQGNLYARQEGQWIPQADERAMILRTPHTPAVDIQALLSVEWRVGEVW